MEGVQKAQQHFFNLIKEKLPPHLTLVDEVEELLGISSDSAYRRIRGEKELSFGEMERLCAHFGVSADTVFSVNADKEVTFRYNPLNPDTFNLHDYIASAYQMVKNVADRPGVRMIYAAKDIPLFHYFMYDELAAFKMFVWQKTLLGFPEFEFRNFSLAEKDNDLLDTGRKLMRLYNQFPSIELWNEETINSFLRQIEVYCEASFFKDNEEALLLIDKLEEYLLHLRRMATLGVKFEPGREPDTRSGTFEMFNNEVVLSDNTVLAIAGERKVTFLTHNAMNFLSTSNEKFCNNTHEWMENILRKSSLISNVSEKQRNQFFVRLNARIKLARERVQYLVMQG